ncbi:MAG: hypothetical protein V1928_02070 [Parcubacteria group bacterium]
MKSESKPKKSLIGGFVGGLIGCMVGILCKNDWLAMILFFVVGFIGYDFKEFIAVSLKVVKSVGKEFKFFFSSFYKEFKSYLPYPYLHIILIPAFFIMLIASLVDGIHHDSISRFIIDSPRVFLIGMQWQFTGHSPFAPQHDFSANIATSLLYIFGNFIVLIGCGIQSIGVALLIKGIIIVIRKTPAAMKIAWRWCLENYFGLLILYEGLIFCFIYTVVYPIIAIRYYSIALWKWIYPRILKAPILLALIIIYAIFGPIFYLFKALGLIAIGIHSFRRMACGISTLAGGIVYLACVPFAINGISLGIQAIFFALGCGLACGIFAAAVDKALDGEKVRNQLDAFIKLSIYKAIPAKIKF